MLHRCVNRFGFGCVPTIIPVMDRMDSFFIPMGEVGWLFECDDILTEGEEANQQRLADIAAHCYGVRHVFVIRIFIDGTCVKQSTQNGLLWEPTMEMYRRTYATAIVMEQVWNDAKQDMFPGMAQWLEKPAQELHNWVIVTEYRLFDVEMN
jgi:hypothetical protein